MRVVSELKEWCNLREKLTNKSIGLVTTMGNLHEGHLSLLRRSIEDNDITVLSIFVNPTQFNHQQDLENYPRTLDNDLETIKSLKVDYVLVPTAEQLYPDDYHYKILETNLSQEMEGVFRPGHFEGMLTVVMKLLQLVKPNNTYFGEKDYQQLQLVQGLVKAFFLDIDVVACDTVRNAEGLALSSRNNRLSTQALEKALALPRLLADGTYSDENVAQLLKAQGFEVDYITTKNHRRFAAVHLAGVRLIDNMLLQP